MSKKKLKCYIYIRVSTAMQVEGYSLEAQKERLNKYADFHDIEVVREYCDAGKSGKNISGRPEFSQMLQDVADDRDGVDFILVFKLSRFGRNAADVLNSLQYIQDFGVNLICVEDGIDSSKDSGKLTITVLSAVAEIERENILVQTMEGRKQKAREGKWNGGQAPFGYQLDTKNSTLVIDPEEAEVVKIIFDKFVHTDMGFESISNYLNQHGYSKKRNRSFEVSHFARTHIRAIIDNPVYAGKIAYGKSSTEKVKGTRDQYRRVKQDDYLLVDGNHEAIIDEDTWQAAQKKRKETGVKWNKTHSLEHEHILSGLLKCPICGTGMAGTVRRRKNKKSGEYKDDFYYRCLHRNKKDEDHFCDFKPSLNQDEINAEVEKVILKMTSSPGYSEAISAKLGEKSDVETLEQEREQYRAQLRQIVGAKNKLTSMLDKLDVNDKHYDRKYQDMQDRLDNLYDKISDLEDSIADIENKIGLSKSDQVTMEYLSRVLKDFDKIYYQMTDLEKKEFMRNFIESIEILPERTESGRILKHIDLRFPIYYEGSEGDQIRLLNEMNVETVALLSKLSEAKHHIEVKVDMDELDLTSAEAKATYKEIQDWVQEKYGFHVTNLNIAQVKQKHGIIERENYNKPKSPDSKQPGCPEEKVKVIEDALRHFQMI